MYIFKTMYPRDKKEEGQNKIPLLIRQRHPSGMILLFDTYGASIYGVIFRLVEDKIIAEKILSDTLISVYHHIEDFRPEFSSFFTWIVKIARSMAKDHIFTSNKSIKDECNKSIFDLVINQGFSIDAIAKSFSITNAACVMELRKELKTITKQL